MEGGERQRRLGFEALRPYDERVADTSHEILEQGCLPDTWLTDRTTTHHPPSGDNRQRYDVRRHTVLVSYGSTRWAAAGQGQETAAFTRATTCFSTLGLHFMRA